MQQYEAVLAQWLDHPAAGIIRDANHSTGLVKQVMASSGKRYYLKAKKSLEEVERELYLDSVLTQYNVPIAAPLISKENRHHANFEGKIFCLYKALAGETASQWYTLEQAYVFGEAISRLHIGLAHCDESRLFVRPMELERQLREWAIPRSLDLDEDQMSGVQEYMVAQFFPMIEELPGQIIHRDAHPYNMLFNDGVLSGFIDFDISTIGPRIFDLCYCSTALLMNDFAKLKETGLWFNLLKELIKGYETNIPLMEIERKAIFPMLLAIQLIFTAYFNDQQADLARMNLEGLLWLFAHQDTVMNI